MSPHQAQWVRWLRNTHGWIGLWGAILGLLFGFSGIWLNHRAVLKLPVAQQRSNAQLTLPDPAPANVHDMAVWLQTALALSNPVNSTRIEPAKAVAWTEKIKSTEAVDTLTRPPLMQPEHWIFNFGNPNVLVQADYWQGNRSVGVTTTANGIIATLSNLHKGTGMSVPWILLIDSLAGSMMMLSLSGVLLWMLTHRRRAVGVAIFSSSVLITLGLVGLRF